MPNNDYDIGSQEWLYSLYHDFWDTNTGYSAGIQDEDGNWIESPDFNNPDFGQGSGDYAFGNEGSGSGPAYGGDIFGYNPNAPTNADFQAGYMNVGQYDYGTWDTGVDYTLPVGGGLTADTTGTFLNLDQWLSEWGQYMPLLSDQDIQGARNIGKLAKDKQMAETLNQGQRGLNYIQGELRSTGKKDIDHLYKQALGQGRLLDFKTAANIYNIEQNYLYDVYGALGDMASQGAFSSGGINEGVWQTSVGGYAGGWGEDADPDNVNFCTSQCQEIMGDASADAMGNCMQYCTEVGIPSTGMDFGG
jgi:hypothetical protein